MWFSRESWILSLQAVVLYLQNSDLWLPINFFEYIESSLIVNLVYWCMFSLCGISHQWKVVKSRNSRLFWGYPPIIQLLTIGLINFHFRTLTMRLFCNPSNSFSLISIDVHKLSEFFTFSFVIERSCLYKLRLSSKIKKKISIIWCCGVSVFWIFTLTFSIWFYTESKLNCGILLSTYADISKY